MPATSVSCTLPAEKGRKFSSKRHFHAAQHKQRCRTLAAQAVASDAQLEMIDMPYVIDFEFGWFIIKSILYVFAIACLTLWSYAMGIQEGRLR